MILHTAMIIEQERAIAPTKYPILRLLFELLLSCLHRGHIHECKAPVQRLVMPGGVDSLSSSGLA